MRIAFFGQQSAFDYNHIGGSESITRRLAKQLTETCDSEGVDYVLFHAPRTEEQIVTPRVRVRYFQTYAEAARALLAGYDHVVSLHLPRQERARYALVRAMQHHRLKFHAFRTMFNPSSAKGCLGLVVFFLSPLNGRLFEFSPGFFGWV